MGTGAQQAEQWRDEIAEGEPETADAPAPIEAAAFDWQVAEAPPPLPSFWRETLPAVVLAILGLAWIAATGWTLLTASPVRLGPLELIGWAGLASGPLALIGILYLLLRRTSRREARRFARSARAMAAQADYLERVLAGVSMQVDEHRMLLAAHAEQLVDQGNQAASRLGEISGVIREDSELLTQSSTRLTAAASAARGDMSTLMAALPRAEAQTREMTELLQDASRSAQEQATTLAGQLATLADHGRDADQAAGTATRTLADHLVRIEDSGATAERRMREAGAEMAQMVEKALDQAAQAVEETRKGMEAQSAAMNAMIEHGRASLDRAGSDSARSLGHRLDELGDKIDGLASRLAAQDAASHALIGNLDKALGEIEQRFTMLGDTGTERTADLAEAIVALTTHVEQMRTSLTGSGDAADALLQRATLLRGSLDASIREIAEALPAALSSVVPQAEKLEAAANATRDLLGAGNERIDQQREAIEQLGRAAEQRVAAVRDQAETLHALILDAEQNSQRLADGSAPRLVEALLQVREAAAQAAENARQTLSSVIPEAAAELGRTSGEAMDRALVGRVEAQMAQVAAAAERAMEAANAASERLMRQMLSIAETSSAVEARITEAKDEAAANDEASFSRRVALLIESLNSTAIDVTKILSNEVTDTAWAAYLRGDRGIFTRRAVRLIDSGEAREIVRHYEQEPEFREQVNRYIHDFEAMLRRILASRESSPLGVTMLSSDMGKLYVALAQAIERLRS
jgi:methyl-accepting chemotaxis protein